MLQRIEDISVDLQGKLFADAKRNVARAALLLEQELRLAVVRATKVSSGSQGSSVFASETTATAERVSAIVGLTAAGDYLKYRIGGVKPAADAEYPGWTKLPPVDKLKKWVAQSGIPLNVEPPKGKRRTKAEKNALESAISSFAFAIAHTLKRDGMKPMSINGMKLTLYVLNMHRARLKSIMEGAA